MNGRPLVALAGVLATILTSAALLPLVADGPWIGQGVALVVTVAVAGEILRRLSVPLAAIGPAQVLLAFMVLLAMLVPEASGPIPTPGSVQAYADLLATGGDDIRRYSPPVPASDGMTAILLTAVAVVAVAVDVVAVTYGQAAAAGLPLLALYSVPAALAEGRLGWEVFAAAAAAYVLLLLAEGYERVGRWGRVLGPVGGGTGSRGATGIAVAALAVAVVVPLVVPLGDNRLVDSGPSAPRAPVTAVDPLVALRDNLRQGAEAELMRYTTDAGVPSNMYLRISTLDRFDGTSWSAGERRVQAVPSPLPPVPGLSAEVVSDRVRTEFRATDGYRQNALPLPYAASEVSVRGSWRYDNEGRIILGEGKQTTRGLRWSVTSLDVRPTPEQLRAAPPSDGTDLTRYRQLPAALDRRIAPLARGIAGGGTPFEQAQRLESWFTGGSFRYDTNVPAGQASSLESFLQNRAGYCEHFATAMAVMSRSLGIASRVVVGFTPGTRQPDGSYVVSTHDAHAWPELYFPGTGWVRFEPTPSRGTSPAWTEEQDTAPAPLPSATPATPAAPTTAPAPQETCTPGAGGPGCGAEQEEVGAPAGTDRGAGVPWRLIGGVVLLIVLAGAAAVPMALRLRRRRRRLSRMGEGPGGADGPDAGDAVLAAWHEVLDTARDLGRPAAPSETPRQVAARLAGGLADDGTAVAARAALPRLAHATERVLYAPGPGAPPDGLAGDVRAIRAALLASAGRGERLRAAVLPSSLLAGRDRAARPAGPAGSDSPGDASGGAIDAGGSVPGSGDGSGEVSGEVSGDGSGGGAGQGGREVRGTPRFPSRRG